LTGHIVPQLKIASLIGIRVLCEAGCKVTFDKDYCDVIYDGKIIVRGYKDASTDLWTLPIVNSNNAINTVPTAATRGNALDAHSALVTHSTLNYHPC
jgi:hypothetical protein